MSENENKHSSENSPKGKRGKRGRGPVLIALLVAAALGIFVVWRLDTSPRTDDAYAYADTIMVAPEVSGRIVAMPIRDNQLVKKGDLLFQIDPRPFAEDLNKARAAMGALEREIELAQRAVNAQEYSAEAARAAVEQANAAVEQAQKTLNRMAPLLKDGYVSNEQVDQARTALNIAKSQQASAMLSAESATAAVSGVDALVAQQSVLKAEVALAELQLEYSTVRAPFDGRVIGLETTEGQFAAAGHRVFTLADTSRWYVVGNFRETDLDDIRAGAPASVYLMSDRSKKFAAVVDSVGFGVQPDEGGLSLAGLPRVPRSINWVRVAQRFPVKFLVSEPDAELFRIGASAVVTLTGRAPEETED